MDDRLSLLSSSPRLRGAPGQRIGGLRGARLIPASAGSTGDSGDLLLELGAHPRVCGEHAIRETPPSAPIGSSPRLRGALAGGNHAACVTGLIPASAGSTTPAPPSPSGSGAHPRVCGEHRPAGNVTVGSAGSSPRLRGAPSCTGHRLVLHRLIPASAGSTTAIGQEE